MACAGSAGGSRPPHQNPTRIPGDCENDDYIDQIIIDDAELEALESRKKRGQRGTAKGLALEKEKKKQGVNKLPIVWHPRFPNMRNDVGKYHGKLSSALGKAIRCHTKPYFPTWRDVDQQSKNLVFEEMRAHFDNIEPEHQHAVLENAGVLYKKWKGRLSTHVKEWERDHGAEEVPCPRHRDVLLDEDWDKYLDYFYSPEFQEKSEVNTQNSRGNKKGTHGRKTIGQRRYQGIQDNDTVIGENVIERDPIDLWADVHRHADGTWVDAQAENNHRMLEDYRSNITPGPRRKLTQEEEDLIFSSALGNRRDYYIGCGPRMATSRASTSTSSIPSSSSCATSSNRDAEVEGLKKKLARLEKSKMKQKKMLDFFFDHYNKTNNTTFGIDDDDDDDDDDGDEEQGDGAHNGDGSQT